MGVKKFDDFMDSGLSKGKPDEEYNQEDLEKGAEIQAEEHGEEPPEVATKIAKDHLEEHPLYYDDEVGLKNFEKELEEKEADVEEDLDKTGAEYDKENDEDELIVQDESFKLFKESLNTDFNMIKEKYNFESLYYESWNEKRLEKNKMLSEIGDVNDAFAAIAEDGKHETESYIEDIYIPGDFNDIKEFFDKETENIEQEIFSIIPKHLSEFINYDAINELVKEEFYSELILVKNDDINYLFVIEDTRDINMNSESIVDRY